MPEEPPKKRIPLTEAESATVLFASDYTCCKCRVPHRRLQIHHIDGDPSNNDPSNLAVLCLECHDETLLQGGFGRTLTPSLVRLYRDQWLRIVQESRSRQAAAMREAYAAPIAGATTFMFTFNLPPRDVIISGLLLGVAALFLLWLIFKPHGWASA